MDPQASAKPPHPPGVALPRGLNPDVALQLLQQSGHGALPGEPLSDAWLQALIDALVDLSSRDALTGLANRRSFELALAREIDRVARSGEPALLLTLDIDHFKQVNDTHGHAAGDLVIQAVARALAETRAPDGPGGPRRRRGVRDRAAQLPGRVRPAGGRAHAQARRAPSGGDRARRVGGGHGQRGRRLRAAMGALHAHACGWTAPTCSCTAPRAKGATAAASKPTAVPLVSAEEKGLLFASSTFQDLT